MSLKAHHDFESSSTCDLRKAGAYRYAEDPETRVWMMSWRLGDGPVMRWHPGEPEPREFLDHVARGGEVCAHNAQFERLIWNVTLRSRSECARWPALRIEQQDDTMARALAIHLPADLDTLGVALGLPTTKDREGHALMMRMAKPRKYHAPDSKIAQQRPVGPEWTRRPDGTCIQWWNTPENLAREGAYCDQDVVVECLVDGRLPPLSADERALWILDQRINDRGVALDLATVERAAAVRDVAVRRANERMAELTGGAVRKVSEGARIVSWLQGRGITCDSIAKGEQDGLRDFARCIGDDVAVAVIDLREEATKTSVAKFDRMLGMTCSDGRARGLHMYHRAGTGRFGGSGIQAQNLPRVDEDKELPEVMAAIRAMETFG